MRLIIKGPLKCSGACAFAWVSSGKSFAFHLDVYGFMHGTTYCLIGHHGNDIVAVGSARLRVNGWIWAWVCSVSVERPLKSGLQKQKQGFIHRWSKATHLRSGVNQKTVDFSSDRTLSFYRNAQTRSWGWWEIIFWAPWSTGCLGSNFRPLTPLKTH